MRRPLKSVKRLSIVARIAIACCLSLILFSIAILIFVKNDIERAIYSETDLRVQSAQNTLQQLVRAKGTPTLINGRLRLGRWVVNGDNSLVDDIHALTGADATIFAVVDGKPIRVRRRFSSSTALVATSIPNSRGRLVQRSTQATDSPA